VQKHEGGKRVSGAHPAPPPRAGRRPTRRWLAVAVSSVLPLLIRCRLIFKGRRFPLLIARFVHRTFVEPLRDTCPPAASERWILLVCNHSLMAEYLAEVWHLVRADERLKFRLLLRSFVPDRSGGQEHIREQLPIPVVGLWQAYVRRWDLIIAPDHVHTALVDRCDCPTLFVPHGIQGGRLFEGEQYTFGKFAYNRRGEIRYTRMFAANEANRDIAMALNAKFADVIAVVGNLHDDQMLELAARRDDLRRNLGVQPDEKVVFVLSTWGPDCLFRTIGDAVLAEARKLQLEFRFVLNIHPLEYRPQPAGERVWGEYLRTQRQHGFLVREPTEDWMRYMVACDIVLTDHTSLALHGALLGRPPVYAPVRDELLEPGSLVWRLREIAPTIRADAADLRARLCQALNSFPKDALNRLAREINSCPGSSADRIRDELYSLLTVAPPAAKDPSRRDTKSEHGSDRGDQPV